MIKNMLFWLCFLPLFACGEISETTNSTKQKEIQSNEDEDSRATEEPTSSSSNDTLDSADERDLSNDSTV